VLPFVRPPSPQSAVEGLPVDAAIGFTFRLILLALIILVFTGSSSLPALLLGSAPICCVCDCDCDDDAESMEFNASDDDKDEIAISCPTLTVAPFLTLHLMCPLEGNLISFCTSTGHPKSDIFMLCKCFGLRCMRI